MHPAELFGEDWDSIDNQLETPIDREQGTAPKH